MECRDVTFSYGRGPRVLDGLTVTFPSGVTTVLGPNGAGKSTLLALLASAARAASGSIHHGGHVLGRRRAELARWRRTVGWVPQRVDPVPGMTALEQVAYSGWLRGMDRGPAATSAQRALAQVGLAERARDPVTSLSGGQVRRVGIASALVNGSDVVVLDEPMAGLDPGQRSRLVRVVQGLPEVDWIISSHQTEDLAALDPHVVVMDCGRIVWQGSVGELRALDDGPHGAGRIAAAYSRLVGEEA